MRSGKQEAVDRLDGYLNAIAEGTAPPHEPGPELAEVDRAFRALDGAPEPSAEFAARLLATLLRGEPPAAGQTEAPDATLPHWPNGRVQGNLQTVRVSEPSLRRPPWAIAQLATAAMLLLTAVAGLYAAGIVRPQRDARQSVIISAATTPPAGAPVELLWETRGGPGLPLTDPFRLAIAPDGNLWITDGRNGRFQIFSPDGVFLAAWGTPGDGEGEFDFVEAGLFGGYGAGAVAFDRDGNIFVADMANRRIQKFAPDRTFLTAWGNQGFEPGDFYGISDIVVDAEGRVYVADYMQSAIQVFDNDGALLASWSKAKGEPPFNPEGLAIDPDGNIWVAEYSQNRVRKLAPDGTRLAAWGEFGLEEGLLGSPYDVAVDAQGRVYVAEDSGDRVQVFDEQGTFLGGWGETGDGEGQFDGPVSLVLDGLGNIYVTDSLNQRVQKFRLLPPFGDDA